jgi:hypothetical protein
VKPLYCIRPTGTGVPKGLVPYTPYAKTKSIVTRILDLYEHLYDADALPVGPRTVGYRLKETYVGEYTKDDFRKIEIALKRLAQSGRLPWEWIADASSVTFQDRGWSDTASFLSGVHRSYRRDRTERQTIAVEVYSEARESSALIRQVCADRGVTAYSGGGSCGPNLASKVATRALHRAVDHGQSTVILGVCDFDQPGIRTVLRPHIEHVAAFLYGTDPKNKQILASNGIAVEDTDATVSFKHLALTPEMAHGLAETGRDRERIEAYIASGIDMWDRDLDLLDGVQKIETEALDPVHLRDLVVTAIEDIIDVDQLDALVREERQERDELEKQLRVASRALAQGGAA